MIIYFVRHGVTEGNETNQFQLPTIELSGKGVAQAKFMARRFDSIPVDAIFSSPMTRAAQTAKFIAERTGHTVIENELFGEILRPSVVRGKSKNDPAIQEVVKSIKINFTNPDTRHSDEENYFDAKARAEKILAFLATRTEENILVVTHGEILRMILSVVAFGSDVTPEIYDRFKRTFIPFNTGISKIQYDLSFGLNPTGWYVLAWNDHAHLGEVE